MTITKLTVSFILDTPSMSPAKGFVIWMSLIDPLEHHKFSHLAVRHSTVDTPVPMRTLKLCTVWLC